MVGNQIVEKPIHGGNVWQAANELNVDVADILDFSANINPLGIADGVLQALRENYGQLQHYPEPQGEACKVALANYLGISTDSLILGNGGVELIYLLGRVYGTQRVIIPTPTFAEYGKGITVGAANVCHVMLQAGDDFKLSATELLAELQAGDLVFVGNPNNPTGVLTARDELEEIIDSAKQLGATVVVDEAFIDFVEDERKFTLRHLTEIYHNLIVVGSMTKFFAIPGLRLGYMVANSQVIKELIHYLPPWNVNSMALIAGQAMVKEHEYIKNTKEAIAKEKKWLTRELHNFASFKVYNSAANFVLIEITDLGMTAASLTQKLKAYKILIRNCDNFLGLSSQFFRVAIKQRADNQQLIKMLNKVIGDL